MSATIDTPSAYASTWRTHTCGELRAAHGGREVALCGAVDRQVDDKAFMLRDGYGATLVRLGPQGVERIKAQLDTTKPIAETVLQAKGKVVARPKPDPDSPTGEVLVEASDIQVLSLSKEPLVIDFHDDGLARRQRIRHRYLYLRRPDVHENFRFRTRALEAMRAFLAERAFDEVDTPLLSNRWTKDAREPFLAIRTRAQIFTLPGPGAPHGPLLMASGFDRTFEVARRFRRKAAYGRMDQPEYSVLDINMAYVDEDDLFRLTDDLLEHVWRALLGEAPAPIVELTYEEALDRYGAEAPDLRFGLEIADLTHLRGRATDVTVRDLLEGDGGLRGFRIPGAAARLDALGAALDGLVDDADTAALHVLMLGGGGKVEAVGTGATLGAVLAHEAARALKAGGGDVCVLAMGRDRWLASDLAGRARLAAGEALALHERRLALVRVSRPPYFRHDHKRRAWRLEGDPLNRPVPEDLDDDPHKARQMAARYVLDGVEIANGALRNHDLPQQEQLFTVLGFDALQIDQRFTQRVDLLRFGVPPHGRMVIGIDRLVTLLRGLDHIDEMIPMPKMPDGSDPLTRSPWPMDRGVVRGLLGV